MNKKFWQGLFAGLGIAIILMFVTFGVYLMIEAGSKKDTDMESSQGQKADDHITIDPSSSSDGSIAKLPIQNIGYDDDVKTAEKSEEEKAAEAAKKEAETAEAKLFEEKLNYILKTIKTNYYNDVDDSVMYDAMLRGLMSSLEDPYSCYFSPDELNELMETTSGEYCGIGAMVSQNYETMVMTIVYPLPDSPALEAGLLPGDIVVAVDGENVEGNEITTVVARMKGIEGTQVNLTVRRGEEEITVTMTRKKIESTFVSGEMLDNNIGYIVISEFYEKTPEQFDEAVSTLEEQGMEGLIIDLRGNPGGLYDSVIKCLDRMLGKDKLLVYTEDKYGNRESEYSKDDIELNIPMVILIDGQSASASEIFTITMQEYGKATVVGTQSFGKGIVQSLYPIYYDGSAVKVTISKYFSPNGVCIHGTGVTPDVVAELPEDQAKTLPSFREKDAQIDKAVEVLMKKD